MFRRVRRMAPISGSVSEPRRWVTSVILSRSESFVFRVLVNSPAEEIPEILAISIGLPGGCSILLTLRGRQEGMALKLRNIPGPAPPVERFRQHHTLA
jgi:hypothetical protein